jgi:hypothetical protein
MSVLRSGLPSAGIFAGPLAWFASLQAKYAAVPWSCAHHFQLVHPMTIAGLVVALAGAGLSGLALARQPAGPPLDRSGGGRPHRFVAMTGLLIALLFGLVIIVQGAAAFLLTGCER